MAWQKISFYSAWSCSIHHLELLSNQMAAFLSAILNSCPITGWAALLNYCPIWWLLSICHLEFLSNQRQFAPQPPLPWHRTLTSTLLLGTRSLPQWVRYPLARTGVPHPHASPPMARTGEPPTARIGVVFPPPPPDRLRFAVRFLPFSTGRLSCMLFFSEELVQLLGCIQSLQWWIQAFWNWQNSAWGKFSHPRQCQCNCEQTTTGVDVSNKQFRCLTTINLRPSSTISFSFTATRAGVTWNVEHLTLWEAPLHNRHPTCFSFSHKTQPTQNSLLKT